MNKIVPFKKEILFDTGINEIVSISLEHNFNIKENNIIEGDFYINGEFKLTDRSLTIDKFNKTVPFTIDIGDNYKIDDASVDIDDFYYEIINNNFLSVNIDLLIKNIEEKEIENDIFEELVEEKEEEITEIIEEDNRCIEEEENEELIPQREEVYNFNEQELEEKEEIKIESQVSTSIFNSDLTDSNYSTYKVYIVKENESLESIILKYEVTKEMLAKYNDLDNIKIGDKLIIPTTNAGN